MATTPRNIRFDDDLYKEIMSLAKYPLSGAYHIQEACKQYLANFDRPVAQPKAKGINPTPIKGGWVMQEKLFERFWLSGMRKVNKKKAASLFGALLKKATPTYEEAFTNQLVKDVKRRIESNQLGFAEMHPTTYLNGERWNDEVIPNGNQDKSGQHQRAPKRTAIEEVQFRRAEAKRRAGLGVLGDDDHTIPQRMDGNGGGGADGNMGETLDGTFTRTD